MTANVITYRGRSAAREVGKVLGIEPEEVDRLAKVMHHFEWRDPHESFEKNLRAVGIDPADETVGHFARAVDADSEAAASSRTALGRHGDLPGPARRVVPLENASMPGRVVIQWDKEDCADMGIVKVDLLGLGMMAVLQDSFAIINSHDHGCGSWTRAIRRLRSIDMAHLPPNDPAVYQMLQEADTIGLFQVESRAQMATLPRLKPKNFYDIVVEVAIIRPGPIVGKMVHPYLSRRTGREVVRYPHPSLEPILSRTLGVPLFQEQLLRMAMVAAGFTGGEAEELRRALGFRRSEERMKRVEEKLRAGDGASGHCAGGDGGDPHVDHVVRALRFSRIARRQLRAHRLCQRVSEGALSGGVLFRDAEQSADGVLSSGDAGEGRAAARRAVHADRRADVRLAVPDRA